MGNEITPVGALSKRERLLARIRAFDGLACPICGMALDPDGFSVVCEKQHRYDLNRHGYLHLTDSKSPSAYSAALFEARRRIFEQGFFDEAIKAVKAETFGMSTVLDAGCGEGYYLSALNPPCGVGIDLSRDAIALAARSSNHLWCVADVARLPFRAGVFDAVLDVLTPANYDAFLRVLKPQGKLLKIFPGENHLMQLRARMRLAPYAEGRVEAALRKNAQVEKLIPIKKTFPLTPAQYRDIIAMTPLTEAMTQAEQDALAETAGETEITIDLKLAVARFQ